MTHSYNRFSKPIILGAIATLITLASPAQADPFDLFRALDQSAQSQRITQQLAYAPSVETQPSETLVENDAPQAANPKFARQIVAYNSDHAPGTIIVDTPNTYLYYVIGKDRAIRYGIGVGRDGFRWSGVQSVTRKAEWPDWIPPQEMIARQPYLPRFMAGGPGNPLGARAMYLGGTIYRIHGTNNPATIGGRVSSGCIRMTNDDVTDLYARVNVGTKVIVLPDNTRRASAS
jgi:lipoprotein-anchoring transpeptidase ErfK/SrfK